MTVVIATLGGVAVRSTIESLNRGTLVPEQILVCIPEREAPLLDDLVIPNVVVVRTAVRGQVAQRAEGFRRATSALVMQLDDDLIVGETCIASLFAAIADDHQAAAGPKWYDEGTGAYHSFLVPTGPRLTLFERLLYWVINGSKGYEPGAISLSGVNMGVPETPGTWNIEWLSGGCILHWRENLVMGNFFPFTGKAYAEDLYHSRLLRARGIRLIRSGDASCAVDFSSSSLAGFSIFWRGYRDYIRKMTPYVREAGKSVFRFRCYVVINLLRLTLRKMPRADTAESGS